MYDDSCISTISKVSTPWLNSKQMRSFHQTNSSNNFNNTPQDRPMDTKHKEDEIPQIMHINTCNNRRLTISPLLLHIQHQLSMLQPLFIRLSHVRIFHQAVAHTKNANPFWSFSLQHTKCFSKGKGLTRASQNLVVSPNIKSTIAVQTPPQSIKVLSTWHKDCRFKSYVGQLNSLKFTCGKFKNIINGLNDNKVIN